MEKHKKVPIIAYLTPLVFIIALYINYNNKTKLGSFHLRQALGLHCYSFIFLFVPFFIIAGIGHDVLHVLSDFGVVILSIFVLGSISLRLLKIYIKAIISAKIEEMNPISVYGNSYQKWFSFIK